ncbi:MAG: hypothetical protein ACR2F2_06300 [Pyrinomonadaceae bacterium]
MKNYIEIFDRRFLRIYENSHKLIIQTPDQFLYKQLNKTEADFPFNSIAGNILRSAGVIEQTFGGITVRLWDDPYEWTLPEELKTGAKILEYLKETEATRQRGFQLLKTDEDLKKEIPAPEKMKTLLEILLETVARAEHFQGRAVAVFQLII